MPRSLSTPRPRQGAHLAALRRAAGLTQAELARAIGASQQNVANWEKSDKPPNSAALAKLAGALGVAVERLLEPAPARARPAPPPLAGLPGPVSQLQKAFEEARTLPRSQQRKIVEFVLAFVAQHRGKAAGGRAPSRPERAA